MLPLLGQALQRVVTAAMPTKEEVEDMVVVVAMPALALQPAVRRTAVASSWAAMVAGQTLVVVVAAGCT